MPNAAWVTLLVACAAPTTATNTTPKSSSPSKNWPRRSSASSARNRTSSRWRGADMGKRQQSQREILPDLYADEQREHRRDRHPHQQSADNCARLERKRKYADERNHLAWIRNNIKEEAEASKAALKANRLGVILEVEMEILNSISDRLLNVLFTYEEMRLWLQTKPDLAAELNVDLSHEV